MKHCLIIIIITLAGARSPLRAQQLASEKPVRTFFSEATKRKLQERHSDRQPVAREARQLPSQKAVQQASVPPQIQPQKQPLKRKATSKKLASERAVDMDKINRQRSRASHASQ